MILNLKTFSHARGITFYSNVTREREVETKVIRYSLGGYKVEIKKLYIDIYLEQAIIIEFKCY